MIKYGKDTRYSVDNASTHDRQQMKATSAALLEEVDERACAVDVIGVDEGQFFPDCTRFVCAQVCCPYRAW